MSSISFVSLNIETNRHLDAVTNLLRTQSPDVVCLQEVIESDVSLLKDTCGYQSVYAPMSHSELAKGEIMGMAILSRGELQNVSYEYYVGTREEIAAENIGYDHNHCFLHGVYMKDDVLFHIGTTHFIKSPEGHPDERQLKIFKDLLPILEKQDDIVFAGDFNAPRGTEIFDTIAKKFSDNIPQEYKTSIDANLHRAGYLPYMVDGLFTTPQYTARAVRLVDGVSDHLAIVAQIEKVDSNN